MLSHSVADSPDRLSHNSYIHSKPAYCRSTLSLRGGQWTRCVFLSRRSSLLGGGIWPCSYYSHPSFLPVAETPGESPRHCCPRRRKEWEHDVCRDCFSTKYHHTIIPFFLIFLGLDYAIAMDDAVFVSLSFDWIDWTCSGLLYW